MFRKADLLPSSGEKRTEPCVVGPLFELVSDLASIVLFCTVQPLDVRHVNIEKIMLTRYCHTLP